MRPQPQRHWLAAILTAFALLTAAGGAHAQTLSTATLDAASGELILVFSGAVSALDHSKIRIQDGTTTTGGAGLGATQHQSTTDDTVTYTVNAAGLATVRAMTEPRLHFSLDALTTPSGSFPRVFDVRDAVYSDVDFNPGITPTGITFNPNGTQMFLTESGDNTVQRFALSTAFDLSTASTSGKQSYSVSLSPSGGNRNPQDVAFNPAGTKMFVINQA